MHLYGRCLAFTIFLFFTSQLFSQVGIESSQHQDGVYLRLKSSLLIPNRMDLGLNYIRTYSPLLESNVLRLQPNGDGNVTIGKTSVSGTTSTNPRLTISASNDANMDLRLEGHGRVSSQGGFSFYIDDNNTATDAFRVISSDGFNLLSLSESYNHTTFGNMAFLGNVAIGSTSMADNYKLSVDGKMIAEEVWVELKTNWPDYVFHSDYELVPLETLAEQIETMGHLPGMPSAQTVEENGVEVGEMNRLLLEKVEELTLHIIELNKRISNLEKSR